ncbi:hypothetical protein EON65_03130 [archaeon]|nr:MAG: hypothetical protein EON65_03130 [archaeon]
MHGVGKKWILRAFETFGHPAPFIVPQQAEPDPMFPTVSFPNPEEKGALDIALAFAKEHNCSVVIANDPDADRLAVAERMGGQDANTWHVFSGNEIGVILGYWHILQYKLQPGNNASSAAVLASIVSSRMLRGIARAEGVQYFDTLTGFKWLGNKAMDLSTAGSDVLFSYEEALGYCCGSVLRDKDGVSAASIFLEIAASLAQGWTDPLPASHATAPVLHTVYGLLQYLYTKYGVYVSYNSYVISRYPKVTDEIFSRIRAGGPTGGYWTHAAGQKITTITDVTKGYDSNVADGVCALPCTPDSHMIMFEFENGASVTLRTSGTEPKIKFYTEMQGSLGSDVDKETLRAQLKAFVDLLVDEMLEPAKNGLQRA